MIGFTLSKLDMLILVTAIFAIILFFMNSLTGIVISKQAELLVSAYVEKVSAVILSESLCFKTLVTVPEFLSYFGSATQPEKIFPFALKISSIQPASGEQGLSSVIMSVANRQFPEKRLSSKRVDVKAKIFLYNWQTETDTIARAIDSSTVIDPQAFPPINSFVLIKELFRDETFLHVIPCSTEGSSCVNNTEKVGCCLFNERREASACVQKLENCPANLSC